MEAVEARFQIYVIEPGDFEQSDFEMDRNETIQLAEAVRREGGRLINDAKASAAFAPLEREIALELSRRGAALVAAAAILDRLANWSGKR